MIPQMEPGPGRTQAPGSDRPEPYFPLPEDLEHPRETARKVFDGLADLYDRARPGYPPAAIDAVVARCRLGASSSVLEVGCGTGQLTRLLAPLGCRIRCLEPGAALARRARVNLAAFPAVDVQVATLEEAEEEETFDAVVAATAFHWVDPEIALAKVARLLGARGQLALFTNGHGAGGSQASIASEVQALHRALAPSAGTWQFPTLPEIERAALAGGDVAAVWGRVERKFAHPAPGGELFEHPWVAVFPWFATYDTASFLELLQTQSSYALMDPELRHELFGAIAELVDERLGGILTKQYLTVVAVARRR